MGQSSSLRMIEVGQTIGNYQITAKLGEGGMGVVYLAEHPVIGRKVALKAIHPELSRNPEVVSRFMTEAKSVNQIGNEHIVDVSDFGTTVEGEFYFIMEYLQGESRVGAPAPGAACSSRTERCRSPPRWPTRWPPRTATGSSTAISSPRTSSSSTAAQTRDFVKVLDFGLAKLTQGEEKVPTRPAPGR